MAGSKKIGFSKKTIFAICALSLAGSAIYELPYLKYVYYDAMLAAFQMTNQQSGFLLSMYAIGCIICYIPGGIIADRFSTKKLIIYSLLSTGVLGIVLCFSMNYVTALIVWFLFAISTSFVFWTGLMKALRLLGGQQDSGSAYGWYYALSSVVALVCNVVFLWIFNMFKDNARDAMFGVIMAMSVSSILAGIIVGFTYKDVSSGEGETEEDDKFKLKDLPLALKNKYVWLASLLMFCMYATYSCSSYFTPFLSARIGISVEDTALIAVIRTYVLFFLSPIGGYVADKILKSTLRVYAIGFVLIGILYIAVVFIPADPGSLGVALAISFLASAFCIMMYGIMWSIMNEVQIPLVYAGTAVGIASIIVYTPDLFLPTVFGNWLDRFGDEGGYTRIFIFLGVLAFVAVILSLYLAKTAKANRAKEEE